MMFEHWNRNALIASLRGYRLADLRADLMAGVTVGIVAVPLAMALAIASGVPPQYGLYTSIVAGLIIALSGGSRFSISGPTAAFVVIIANLKPRMQDKLLRAGIREQVGRLEFAGGLEEARERALSLPT